MVEKLRSSTQETIQNCYECVRKKNLLYDDKFMRFVALEDDVSLIRDGGFRYDSLPELRDNYERPSTK